MLTFSSGAVLYERIFGLTSSLEHTDDGAISYPRTSFSDVSSEVESVASQTDGGVLGPEAASSLEDFIEKESEGVERVDDFTEPPRDRRLIGGAVN